MMRNHTHSRSTHTHTPSSHLPSRRAIALVGAISLVLMVFSTPMAGAAPDDPIAIPDELLLACVNATIDSERAADQEVTEGEAAGLTDLNCTGSGPARITDLTGLEHFTGLTNLTLSINDLRSEDALEPLAGLTSLTRFVAPSSGINNLGPLANLTGLTTLSVAVNEIEDITPLANLTSLTLLHLGTNDIEDVTPLAGLTNLTTLNLNGNHIVDVSPVEHAGASATALNQTWDLGDIEAGEPQPNPVVGFSGSPVPLSGLYDSSTNTFTADEGDPTALTWADDDEEPRFSGTLSFQLLPGNDNPPPGDDDDPGDDNPPPGDDNPPPGDDDPGDDNPPLGDDDDPGDDDPPPTDTSDPGDDEPESDEPGSEPSNPVDSDSPADDEADRDVGAEGAAAAETQSGAGTLPRTGFASSLVVVLGAMLLAVGLAIRFTAGPLGNRR